jgi:hypothetical protein
MMGHRLQMIDGAEYDALTRGGRRVHAFRAGRRAYIKRKYRRRERQFARRQQISKL